MRNAAEQEQFRLGSIAEDQFIELFSETFGPDKTKYLSIQYSVVDIYGRHRSIDFALESDNERIAIEIDGETYHNPARVSSNKYYDDLLKQNSLVHQNWKVFRWAYKQLTGSREKVKDELITFLGDFPEFKEPENHLLKQRGKVFTLKEHQQEAIEQLDQMRRQGETIALLYHATGVGKTVTAVTDAKSVGKRTLFVAHTKELITQAKDTFYKLWPEIDTGLYIAEHRDKDSYVVCASLQSLTNNLNSFSPEDFGYLVIDEAHHGSAQSYQKILGYFKPEFTLGLTATPERADGEDILSLFKNVAHKLDIRTAVEIGELSSVRCIRIKTNVDLSTVRINGIKYNSQELESKLFVPERNKIIVSTYTEFVRNKKTVVFCASVKHAQEVAALFRAEGLRAEAVSGTINTAARERILAEYENGAIHILCACDLLNEGWDSPKTEVLFMARPTMSKTIYMQQLGRGMRKSEGKDYLMVFDFIDNANLFNMPYSLHRMFELSKYKPGEYVLAPEHLRKLDYDMFAKGEKPAYTLDFPLYASDYEMIDLFNWQDSVKDMISQIEFVRMVNVQSETIEKYLRTGKITPDLEIPMSSRKFNYFKKETIEAYAQEFKWELITPGNMKDKFIEMVRTMDMSYSYKPVLLKAMLKYADAVGGVCVEDIVDYFIEFYGDRRRKGLVVENSNSIYCKTEVDRKAVERNIFTNPFKRFEDMRFMRRARDLEYVEFNGHVWKRLTEGEKEWIGVCCEEKLVGYYLR